MGIIVRGLAMGMAEVVPGVSGGTIAFITGIYERLIDAIKNISNAPVAILRREGLAALWKHIDGNFLVALAIGMVLGILVGVLGISYLLEHYPPIIWGFFFGLIVGSVVYIARQISKWRWQELVLLILGAVIAYTITILSPAQGSDQLWIVFLAGAIAVCALILPGISGSFILLLMGMYPIILHAAKSVLETQDTGAILIMLIFILGCIVGIMIFSNFLSWTFRHFRFPTLALLTGFMMGSLNRIWPWRNPISWLNKETGEQMASISPDADIEQFQLLTEENVWPAGYTSDPMILGSVLGFILGILLVYLFSVVDIHSKSKN